MASQVSSPTGASHDINKIKQELEQLRTKEEVVRTTYVEPHVIAEKPVAVVKETAIVKKEEKKEADDL